MPQLARRQAPGILAGESRRAAPAGADCDRPDIPVAPIATPIVARQDPQGRSRDEAPPVVPVIAHDPPQIAAVLARHLANLRVAANVAQLPALLADGLAHLAIVALGSERRALFAPHLRRAAILVAPQPADVRMSVAAQDSRVAPCLPLDIARLDTLHVAPFDPLCRNPAIGAALAALGGLLTIALAAFGRRAAAVVTTTVALALGDQGRRHGQTAGTGEQEKFTHYINSKADSNSNGRA